MNIVRNWMAVIAVIVTYLVQIYSDGVGTKFGVTNVAIIVFVALMVGALTYGGVTVCIRALQNSQKKLGGTASSDNLFEKITSSDLCKVCDQLTIELHQKITDSLPLPEFDSDLVEDMNQGISSSWLGPSAGFSYGIVAISMLKRDSKYLQSSCNDALRNHVLEKMAKKMNETSLICKSEENDNHELVDEVTEDLKVVVRAVSHYFSNTNEDDNVKFAKLIDYLTMKVHRDLKKKLPEIADIAAKMVMRVEAQV